MSGIPAGKTDCRRCAHWCAMTNSAGVRAPRHGCNVPPFRQGTRIATPVCALARNDMQKLARCQRLQGRYSLPPVIARSEATWQSVLLAAAQSKTPLFPANTQLLRICPKYCQLAKFPCGDADCHTSAIQATHPSPRLFRRKSQVLSLSAASPSPGRTGAARFHFALVRNDMQKTAAFQRMQGRGL